MPNVEKAPKAIFNKNRRLVMIHNILYKMGKRSFELKLNEYAYMDHQKFILKRNGFVSRKNMTGLLAATFMSPEYVELPKKVDWRTLGAVTPIKNQGNCGSCWAFSATGALEGQHFRKTGKLISLSEQNLVDCSVSFGNDGCNGGDMDVAFKYIKDNGGIDNEESYPYEADDNSCRYRSNDIGASDVGFTDLPSGDENALKAALATIGPVSVAIDASQASFLFYSKGIYDDPDCNPENLDHGVLAVGYGTEDGQDYWLVKNSWGSDWGENGYVKIARNKNNMCGIASEASYPLV